MSEIVMTTEAKVEDFTDELSDEALDRVEGGCLLSLHVLSDASAPSCFMRLHAAGGPGAAALLSSTVQ